MNIKIDSREKEERIKNAIKFFHSEGYHSDVQLLDFGDYLFDDKVLFEFKTYQDFMNSINDSSVFQEVINQAENYEHNFIIIIVGDEYEELKKRYYYYKKTGNHKYSNLHNFIKIQKGKFNGAVRRLRTYSNVILANTETDAIEEMLRQAEKCLDGKVNYANIVRPSNIKSNVIITFLTCIKGVNVKTAERIVETLDLCCLDDLLRISVDDLLSVDGVGEVKANKIFTFLHMNQK